MATSKPIRRVFMVTWWLGDFGGAEQLITDHAIALTEAGVEVTVFSEMPAGRRNQYVRSLVSSGVRVVSPSGLLARPLEWAVPRLRRRTISKAVRSTSAARHDSVAAAGRVPRRLASALTHWGLRRAISEAWAGNEGTLLNAHGFGVDTAWLALWARARRLPVVYTEHGSIGEHGGALPAQAARWLAATDVVICWPGEAQGALERLAPSEPAKFRPLKHVLRETPNPEKASEREPGRLNIACVGRMVRDKGIDILIRAFAGLAADHPRSKLLLFGDGEDREAFRRLARRLNIEDIVEFRGAFDHSQIGAVMEEIDIFVLPSLTEGTPLAILEAMAYSKPVLATDVGTVSTLVQDGQNGLLVPAGDASALQAALGRLVDEPDLRSRFATASARTVADGGFSPAEGARTLLGYYSEAMERASRRRTKGTPS